MAEYVKLLFPVNSLGDDAAYMQKYVGSMFLVAAEFENGTVSIFRKYPLDCFQAIVPKWAVEKEG